MGLFENELNVFTNFVMLCLNVSSSINCSLMSPAITSIGYIYHLFLVALRHTLCSLHWFLLGFQVNPHSAHVNLYQRLTSFRACGAEYHLRFFTASLLYTIKASAIFPLGLVLWIELIDVHP